MRKQLGNIVLMEVFCQLSFRSSFYLFCFSRVHYGVLLVPGHVQGADQDLKFLRLKF